MSESVLLESSRWDDYADGARYEPETEMQSYKVKENECISEITRRLTGRTDWRPVYELNKDVIGSNPNGLKAGMILKIPNAAVTDYDSLSD